MNVLTDKEGNLFYHVMSTFHDSVLGIRGINSLSNVTNPNAHTYIIDAEPESVDITLEVTNRNKDVTDILITQNSDRFSSEKTVSFPTNKLTDVETIHSLRDIIKTQYKLDAMRTILQNSLLFHQTNSSVEETKDSHGNTEFTYTFWGYGTEPVRFVINETFMDLPPRGGSLQYQEFDTFNKKWNTQASYISEALMSTKEHIKGNETIVGVPTIYGDKWSITDFVTKQTLRKTLEQNLIMTPLHQITNLDPTMYGGVNLKIFDTKLLDTINQDYNIAYKIPDPSENRICDVDLYIYPADQTLMEPNEHTKRFILRYQHPTDAEFGYFTAYDPTGPEPKLIARTTHTSKSVEDMIHLTNHLKELSGPAIEKQVTKKKQLSRFSLNLPQIQEEHNELEP
jgi:hypothetical protein